MNRSLAVDNGHITAVQLLPKRNGLEVGIERDSRSNLDATLFEQLDHKREDAWLDADARHGAMKIMIAESAPKRFIKPRRSKAVERHLELRSGWRHG